MLKNIIIIKNKILFHSQQLKFELRRVSKMHGMMMDRPLKIIDILKFAEEVHPQQEIISRTLQNSIHTTNYSHHITTAK